MYYCRHTFIVSSLQEGWRDLSVSGHKGATYTGLYETPSILLKYSND